LNELAINGGKQTIPYALKKYNSIGDEEKLAAIKVLDSGILSGYVGSWGPSFYGGPVVQEFERNWADYFEVKHAIAVNSWTSGLICAVGAIGVQPGDEIIVSPFTMSASATAILHWNAIPIFADIDPIDFCISPQEVEKLITSRTKAILAVDIFGQSCRVNELRELANRHGIKLILDTAQSPGARTSQHLTGTQGDIGGFSLNYHKHIHTGEGGVLVTNDDEFAEKMRMIRNHAEAVVSGRNWTDLTNMVGFNFRLGEIEAAIGIEQLKKLENLANRRSKIGLRISAGLSQFKSVQVHGARQENTHVYYMLPISLKLDRLNCGRDEIADALEAEGVQGLSRGYTNIHLLPLYQNKIAFGSNGFPWSLRKDRMFTYQRGICPVAEKFHEQTLLTLELCQYEYSDQDVDLTLKAFTKVLGYFQK
jgi:dTDP-4-amino-4,6-dideoxygalactose transaminase